MSTHSPSEFPTDSGNGAARRPEGWEPAASIALHPRILQVATFPPFDLFGWLRDEGRFALFLKADEPVFASTWRKLDELGIPMLYASVKDRPACLRYVEEHLQAIVASGDLPPAHEAEWAYNVACRALEDLFANTGSAPGYERVRRAVDAVISSLQRRPEAVWDMLRRAPHAYSNHAHSANVCILLAGLAQSVLGSSDPRLLREVAVGGALHDLGKAEIPPSILNKDTGLTPREFAQIMRHPRRGARLARPHIRSLAIAQSVILQHHEDLAGGGYPDGRSGEGINKFARAARIADTFDALTSQRPYGPPIEPYEALSIMVNEMRGKFDLPMLRTFIRHMAAIRDEGPVQTRTDVADGRAEAKEIEMTRERAAEGPAAEQPTEGAPVEEALPVRTEALREDALQPMATEAKPADGTPIAPVLVPVPALVSGQEPAGPADADAAAVGPLTAVRDLVEEREGDIALMRGIMSALQAAVRSTRRPDAFAETREAERAGDRAHATDRAAEIEFVRSLFPIVQQIDGARERLAADDTAGPEAAAARADALASLDGVRESVVQLLGDHRVQLADNASRAGARARRDRQERDLAQAESPPERRKAG